MKKAKFKIGDKVKLSNRIIKWYLTTEGQDIFFPLSGIQNDHQSRIHDDVTVSMLSLCMKNDMYGEITDHHWPSSRLENFRIYVLGCYINVSPRDLTLIESVEK